MPSHLQKICDAVIEAAWLAALIVAPLFFDVYSQRVFEPDKISLVRSLALIALVAWVVKKIETWRQGRASEDGRAAATAESPLWRKPLVLPVLLLAAAYLLSTALSVVPRTSFWGSYQRLQGTFSMYSYMALFLVALDTLRTRSQWQRLQYTIILTSVPIALYAILQRAQLDPLPWGGDTFERVAGNMGNAIFVAAYLIMTAPLTLERLISASQRMLLDKEGNTTDALTAGAMFFVLVIQLVAIILTQSRGPWLGLAAGGYVFILLGLTSLRQHTADRGRLSVKDIASGIAMGLVGWGLVGAGLFALLRLPRLPGLLVMLLALLGALALYLVPLFRRRGWRWLWLSVITQGLVAVILLGVITLPGASLNTAFKQIPYVGRLAQLREVESGTGLVRVLIWKGVVDMMKPHAPLTFPDGRPDALNPVRQIIGYGPEAMWVAFNRFYRPELGGLEARNASPDRSHNETFDSLVTTGVIGFLAYILLFASVFFFALRWLGLVHSRRDSAVFVFLGILGAILGVLFPILAGVPHYAGVGVAIGFMAGVLLYITYAAAKGSGAETRSETHILDRRQLLIIALLATVVAHFVEIHLGIAIAATRTYFYVLIAALVAIGLGQLPIATPATEAAPTIIPAASSTRAASSKRRPARPSPAPPAPAIKAAPSLWRQLLPYTFIVALIFLILDWDFVSNQLGRQGIFTVFLQSWLTHLREGALVPGAGVLWIILFTLIVGLIIGIGETTGARVSLGAPSLPSASKINSLLTASLIYLGVTLGVWLLYGLYQAQRILPLPDSWALEAKAGYVAGHITAFYLWLALLLVILVAILYSLDLASPNRWSRQPLLAGAAAFILGATALYIISININLVRADIYFKLGQNTDSRREWRTSLFFYDLTSAVAPREDYYQLFRGRALLESARAATTAAEQNALLTRAEQVLLNARDLNPLNTDHSANLARYYATRAAATSDPAQRTANLQRASDYYRQATTLSPNTAHLQNEWGTALMQLGEIDQARIRFARSLELDKRFVDTYLRLAQLESQQKNWEAVLANYNQAAKLAPRDVRGLSGRAFALAQLGRADEAIAANLEALAVAPGDISTLQNLALLYQQQGQLQQALRYARQARDLAAPEQQPALDALIQQLQNSAGQP